MKLPTFIMYKLLTVKIAFFEKSGAVCVYFDTSLTAFFCNLISGSSTVTLAVSHTVIA